MSNDSQPLEDLSASGAHYSGSPEADDLAELPVRDRRTPGTLVGRSHMQSPTILNIVNSEGQGFPVDLSQITPDQVKRVQQPFHSFGTTEEAAVATFRLLASSQNIPQSASARHSVYNGVVVQDARAATRARPMGQPEAMPTAAVTASSAAQGPGYVEQGVRSTYPNLVTGIPTVNQVEPPRQQVTYEIPGYGPLDVFYHQVIRAGDHLVLVFDKRYVGQRGFPRHSHVQLGMRIHGTDKLFMVQTTGIEFDLDTKALCLLTIVEEGSYSEYQAQNDPLQQVLGRIPFPGDADDDGETRDHYRKDSFGKLEIRSNSDAVSDY